MRMIALPAIRAVAISALVLAASLSPAAAAPQHGSSAATPSRIDNIWGWRAHQPTAAEVSGLEPHDPATLRAQREANDQVDQLYQQLMRQSAG